MTKTVLEPARELLSVPQAARLLRCQPRTVLNWIEAGKLPAARTPGGHYRISKALIEAMLAEAFRGDAA